MPSQHHDAGVTDMSKLQAEICDRCDGESSQGQCQSGLQRRSLPQHDCDNGCRDDPDDGSHGQTAPVGAYRQSIGAEPDPVLHASVAHAGEPQSERRQWQEQDPPVETRNGAAEGGNGCCQRRGERGSLSIMMRTSAATCEASTIMSLLHTTAAT